MADALDAVVTAARRKIEARRALEDAQAAVADALRGVHASGVPKTRIAEHVGSRLRAEGFDEEDLAVVALSPSSVRHILDR